MKVGEWFWGRDPPPPGGGVPPKRWGGFYGSRGGVGVGAGPRVGGGGGLPGAFRPGPWLVDGGMSGERGVRDQSGVGVAAEERACVCVCRRVDIYVWGFLWALTKWVALDPGLTPPPPGRGSDWLVFGAE